MTIIKLTLLAGLSALSVLCTGQRLGDSKSIIYSMALQPSTGRVAAVKGKNLIEIWDYNSKTLVKSWNDSDRAIELDWGPNWLIVGYKSGTVRIFDSDSFQQIKELKVSESPLTNVKYIYENHVALSDKNGGLYVIDVSQPEITSQKITTTKYNITDIDYVSFQNALIISSSTGEVATWRIKDGVLLNSMDAKNGYIFDMQYIPEFKQVLLSFTKGRAAYFLVQDTGFGQIGGKVASFSGWATCVHHTERVLAVGSVKEVVIVTKAGVYEYDPDVIVNFIYVLPENPPSINVILGTQGRGIEIVSAEAMKVVNK